MFTVYRKLFNDDIETLNDRTKRFCIRHNYIAGFNLDHPDLYDHVMTDLHNEYQARYGQSERLYPLYMRLFCRALNIPYSIDCGVWSGNVGRFIKQ